MARPDLIELRRFAEELADAARASTMRWFRRPIDIETKADMSPVTLADRETEERLREMITERFPDHGIFGEELGHSNPDAEFQWVLDPIDGTRSFIAGVPSFGCLIGVMRNNEPVVGVIEQPAMHERFIGVKGRPSFFNSMECRTSDRSTLAEARVFATTPDMFTPEELVAFDAVSLPGSMRRFGLDCYAFGLLAAGHADIVMESDLKPHDILPIVPVIEGAGGRVCDWQGRALGLESGPQVIAAASDALLIQALDAISEAIDLA